MSSPEQSPFGGDNNSLRIFGFYEPRPYRKICVRCGRWGFFASDTEATKSHNNTARFPVLHTSCCQNCFCTDCILSTISDELWHGVWRPQESGYGISISCPARSCEARRLCLNAKNVTELLNVCGIDRSILTGLTERFRRAFEAQRSIHDMFPGLTELQGAAGSDFHRQLASSGHMWPCDGTWPRGTIMRVYRFHCRGRETIPVFLGLFKDMVRPKRCVICDGVFQETASGEVMKVVFYMLGDSQGTLRTGKSSFPPRSVFLDCYSRHKLNCCVACYDRHIVARLDDNQEVTCPELDCENILTPSQVKAVARPDTFERYEAIQLQKGLNTMPSFRWCLRERCRAGQDYDIGGCSTKFQFFILCNACHFAMCFLHNREWHFGQTCDEYDKSHNAVGGRDPETHIWLLEHTKPCPGCEIPVEKNGGCFHMTCDACKMEFCWVCLADWKNIFRIVDGRPTYDVSGHNRGCDFRQTHVRPQLAFGNDAGEAIREAEDIAWQIPQ